MQRKRVGIWGAWGEGSSQATVRIDDNGLGVLDQGAHKAFTRGHCHSLALAINKLTGWKMIVIGDSYNSPQHFLIHCPPLNDYIDIDGPGAIERFKFYADSLTAEFDVKDIDKLEYYKKPDPEMAEPFALALLKKLGVDGNSSPKKITKKRTRKVKAEVCGVC